MKTGKMISFIALATIMMIVSTSSASARGTALGVIVGEPTGFSGKLWTSSKTAFAAGLAWSLDNNAGMHIHVDYLWHKTAKLKRNRESLPWYYGIGGRLKTNNNKNSDDFLGVRFPIGLEFFLEDTPLDLFIEIVPVFDIAPKSELDFNAAIGLRIVF